MSEYVINHVAGMIELAGKTVNKFGKDSTGTIKYTFNNQGFRSDRDYVDVPDYAFFGCSLVFGIGVDNNQLFANMFNNSHNYGLAGTYTNHDIFQVIEKFNQTYNNNVKKVVCWTDRDSHLLSNYSPALADLNFYQFFCGDVLHYQNCFKMLPDVDRDVSQSHMGVNSHKQMYKVLCALFKQ